MPTDLASLDALYPLPAEELPRQWLLTREADMIPEAWERQFLEGWFLGAHPDARVAALLARDGSPIGWVMEPLAYLSPTGDILPEESLTLSLESDAMAADFERALYGRDDEGRSSGDGFAGTWTAVVFGGAQEDRFQRVYVAAAHSVVFSSDRRAVATTHNLIKGLRRNEALSCAFDCLATNAYFTFGLTAFEGLRRLLPNHFLDLDSFEPTRHWPVGPLEPLASGREGAEAIVDYARRLIAILRSRHDRFLVFLSAGRDSRAVLAVLRPFVDEGVDVLVSTSYGWNFESRIDAQAARRLARISGLPHELKRRRPHDSRTKDVLRGFARVGEAAAGSNLSAPGVTTRKPSDGPFKIGGMGGETARAFWWNGRHRAQSSEGELNPEDLVRRTRSPQIEAVVLASKEWLRKLPDAVRSSRASTLDLAYIELRMGCWQAPMSYLFTGARTVNNPMIETFPVETMLRLPESYRAAQILQRDMVAYGWPELLAIPFNEPRNLLRLWQLMRRVPGIARRIVRRRLRAWGWRN